MILGALEDPITCIYLHFLCYTMNLFNEFNTVFQSETPLLHEVKSKLEALIRTMAGNFMENYYVSEEDPMSISPLLEARYLPNYEVYLGISFNFQNRFDIQLNSYVGINADEVIFELLKGEARPHFPNMSFSGEHAIGKNIKSTESS